MDNGNVHPFPASDIRQDGIFLFFPDVMILPVISGLVAGLLPHHTLLDQFLASSMLLPKFPRPV
jgi:hypothetical protein